MLDEIQNLPIGEKLRLVEELWDSIFASSEPFPIQEWHRVETIQRAAQLDEDPSIAISRDELWQRAANNDKQ